MGIMQSLLPTGAIPPVTPPPTPPTSPPSVARPRPVVTPASTPPASLVQQSSPTAQTASLDDQCAYAGFVPFDSVYEGFQSIFKAAGLDLHPHDVNIEGLIAFMNVTEEGQHLRMSACNNYLSFDSADTCLAAGYGVCLRMQSSTVFRCQMAGRAIRVKNPSGTLLDEMKIWLRKNLQNTSPRRRRCLSLLSGDIDCDSKSYTDVIRKVLRGGVDVRVYGLRTRNNEDWAALQNDALHGAFPNTSYSFGDLTYSLGRFLTRDAATRLDEAQRRRGYIYSDIKVGYEDWSNTQLGLKRVYSTTWTELNTQEIDIDRMANFITSFGLQRVLLATNTDHWTPRFSAAFRGRATVKTRPLERQPDGTMKEVGIDELLIDDIYQLVAGYRGINRRLEIVLFTGDGQPAGKHPHGFVGAIRWALAVGADVSIYSFRQSTSFEWRDIQDQCDAGDYPNSTYSLHYLDAMADTFVTDAGKRRFQAARRGGR